MLPGILAASLGDPLDINWIRQIVEYGIDMGLPMDKIYEQKRNSAINNRGIAAPSYDRLMQGSDRIKKENPMDSLFEQG